MKKLARKMADFLTETVAPVEIRCLNCGKDVFDDLGFCEDCLKQLRFNNGKTCLRCGVAVDGEADYCGNCAFDKVYFDKAYSAFCYEGAVKSAILQMKFNNCGTYAKVFARYLVYLAKTNGLEFDVVCYAPMSKKSFKERGYNQSELLARHFCDILDKRERLVCALKKVKETERQERLGKTERKTNLVGAYEINADVKGMRVLVVDDVKTTGSTLNECAKILKRHGALSVECITVASREENVKFEREELI